MRKPVVLITGASGEIGHGLIDRLADESKRGIVTLDLAARPVDRPRRSSARSRARSSTGRARAHPRRVRGRPRLPPRGAALDALGVHADDGARGQRRGHAQPARVRAARGRVARPAGHLPLSVVDRGLRPAEPRREEARRAASARTLYTHPTTMYGCNKLYCEQLGHYYARHYKQLSAESASGRVDFRCVRFPGLISAVTVPSGGTSDYAPEMIHAAAKGEPYACFVRPDTRIPFMAMPDGVDALLQLAAAPRERADADRLQRRRVQPDRRRRAPRSAARVPRRRRSPGRSTRSARASSTRGPTTSTTAPRGATGASPRATTSNARSRTI